MIEPEMAFYDINDNMDLAEDFIKHLVQYALDNCYDDIKFLNDRYDPELIERLRGVIGTEFVRLEYTEGIKILEQAVKDGVQFPHRGERNESKYIPLIAAKIAELKGTGVDEVAQVTTGNARRLFNI